MVKKKKSDKILLRSNVDVQNLMLEPFLTLILTVNGPITQKKNKDMLNELQRTEQTFRTGTGFSFGCYV